MTRPEPLKDKVEIVRQLQNSKEHKRDYGFWKEDIKSAVELRKINLEKRFEWLKNHIIFPQDLQQIKLAKGIDWKFINKKIDEALKEELKQLEEDFGDVMKK